MEASSPPRVRANSSWIALEVWFMICECWQAKKYGIFKNVNYKHYSVETHNEKS